MRNTLRRPFRLALILLALSTGGALLLTMRSNYESLMSVIDTSLATQGHDIEALMARALPGSQLEAVARSVPEMQIAEAWRRAIVSAAGAPALANEGTRPLGAAAQGDARGGDTNATSDGVAPIFESERKRLTFTGYPIGSRLFKLPIVEGRLPAANATDEVLMTRNVREAYPEIRVGSDLPLRFRDRRVNVRVVGLVEEIGTPTLYAGFATFDSVTALGDASTVLRAKAGGDHLETVASALDQALLDAHLPPAQLITRAMFRDALDEHFKVVGDVMQMVALAAALVGAIILGASTSFNVLERGREIGVMRALGATPRSIAMILLAEASSIACIGALLSIAISIALTLALNDAAARTLLHVAVPLHFSLQGMIVLSGGALVVIFAVWLVLESSLRRSVRETLSYDG